MANIGQTPLGEWTDAAGTRLFRWERLDSLTHEVVDSDYRIIEGKGATNYAIGLSGAHTTQPVCSS